MFVCVSVAVTLTPGIAAPDESVTVAEQRAAHGLGERRSGRERQRNREQREACHRSRVPTNVIRHRLTSNDESSRLRLPGGDGACEARISMSRRAISQGRVVQAIARRV